MAKNIKHSKIKNTGVMFELLVRQVTSDTLNGMEKSPALKIVKEYFKRGKTLKKELDLKANERQVVADRELIAYKLDVIMQDIEEIKQTLKEKK